MVGNKITLTCEIYMTNLYYTVVIPYISAKFATEWHPMQGADSDGALVAAVTRGSFETHDEAVAWAQGKLNGTPYRVKLVECAGTF